MLTGIQPGTVGVGGVTITGRTGVAFITFEPVGGGEPGQSKFGLTIEGDRWMICRSP